MANTKITGLVEDTSPTSDDLVVTVNDAGGTPGNKKVTATNLIKKAHGLSDGLIKVATGTMAVATAGTDYATAGHTHAPAGADTEIQYNDGGVMGSEAGFVYDKLLNKMTVTAAYVGTLTSNNAELNSLTIPNSMLDVGGGDYSVNGGTISLSANSHMGAGNYTIEMPAADGTMALTSDISAANVAAAGAVMESDFNAKGDLLTASADNTPAVLTAGTDGYILTADSAQANGIKWAELAAAKKTYDYVVAASGGDYTTLGAALAVMTAGQSVFVRKGTYVESGAVSVATNSLTIVGESGETSIISHSSYGFTLSGTDIHIQNLGFTSTSGANVFNGNYLKLDGCTFRWSSDSGSGYRNNFSGYYTQIANNKFYDTRGSATGNAIRLGAYGIFSGNYCEVLQASGVNWLEVATAYYVVENNYFKVTAGGYNASNIVCRLVDNCVFTGNTIDDLTGSYSGSGVRTGAVCSVTGNVTYGTRRAVYVGGSRTNVTGNALRIANTAGVGIYAVVTCTITGNHIYNSSGAGAGGVGIDLASGSNTATVSGNTIEGFGVGIQLASGLTAANVSGNTTVSCTAAITNSGITSGNILNNTSGDANNDMKCLYMKNTSGGALAAGDVVVFKSVAAGDEVTTTTTAGDDKVFGMCTAAISSNAYGYVQTLGKTTLLKVDGTTDIAIGDFLTTFTTAGIAAKATAGDMVFAIALEAYIADNSSGVIDALLITPRLI